MKLSTSVHPEYDETSWEKYRYIMDGGDDFIDKYLESYSSREDVVDFTIRKRITPNPSFASGSITDIKNAIFQRMHDILRVGGSKEFQEVYAGKLNGVDLSGATANYFIGNKILPELLNMGKVGVYVDMPLISGQATVADSSTKHPYYYVYKTEAIRNWVKENDKFTLLLLEETALTYDEFGLPDEEYTRYRMLTKEDGQVTVRFYDTDDKQIDLDGGYTNEVYVLEIEDIPFVVFELNYSLLKNIANHQIALLNLESSDIGYALKSNFPFYVEQENRMTSGHLKNEESVDGDDREITAGGSTGRTYSTEQAPSFIHPSPAPLMASIEKQKQLKDDIRTLINLALSAVQPKFASAAAKEHDEHGLESGLSFIGLILEHGERQLAAIFSDYINSTPPTIQYPTRYALKSDQERIDEAKALNDMLDKIPSKKGQKAITKLMARKLLDAKVSQDELLTILKEIDDAKYITSDPNILSIDLEKGLVSTQTASTARGYADDEAEKAKTDHAERVQRIQDAQTPRGVDDLGTDVDSSRLEKQQSQDSDLSDDTHKKVRGDAVNTN